MNSLSFLTYLISKQFISKRWIYFLALSLIMLVLAHPLLVNAKPATGLLAQSPPTTPSPQLEEEQDREDQDAEDQDDAVDIDQPNIEFSDEEAEAEPEQEAADASATVLPTGDSDSYSLPHIQQPQKAPFPDLFRDPLDPSGYSFVKLPTKFRALLAELQFPE